MGAGQPFSSQFLPHAAPRGPAVPAGMSPAGMAGVMGPSGMAPMSMSPARAPGMSALYSGQRMPQHAYPGPPQSQQLPRQGVKRAYSSEVSVGSGCLRPPQRGGTVPGADAVPAGIPGTAVPAGRAVPRCRHPVRPQRPPALRSVPVLPRAQDAAGHGPVPLRLGQHRALLQGTEGDGGHGDEGWGGDGMRDAGASPGGRPSPRSQPSSSTGRAPASAPTARRPSTG